MVDMPDRIRVAQDADGFWTCREAISGSQEYVRADLYAALEAQLAETQEKLIEANDKLIRQNEAIFRTGAVKVKPLDEDDYEEIIRAAAIKMRKATYGARGQIITVQDCLDWWVMKETESRILAALEPAEPVADAEPGWKIVRQKFYHSQWGMAKLLEARNGGLITDEGEAWHYQYTSKDGTGGRYDMLFRRVYTRPQALAQEANDGRS